MAKKYFMPYPCPCPWQLSNLKCGCVKSKVLEIQYSKYTEAIYSELV